MNKCTRVEFEERMSGFFIPKKFLLAALDPMARHEFTSENDVGLRQEFEFNVSVSVPDLEAFLKDHSTPSEITGSISDFRFAAQTKIEKGYFQLFTKPTVSPDFDTAKEMHYTIFFRDAEGMPWTFFGFKEILKEEPSSLWSQTTTLYFYVWEGHSTFDTYADKNVHVVGSLRIAAKDFLQQMKSFRTNDQNFLRQNKNLLKYYKAFAGSLWESYAPFVFTTTKARWNDHTYPVHTTQGVKQGDKFLYPLDTRDGLTVSLQRFKTQESKDVVLLLHGLTTSTDMYIMPEHQNLVNHLHEANFSDVWSLDWRGSGRFVYNITPHQYSIDDVAKYDIPAAVEFIRSQCGADVRIHVIAHCVGSLALMASFAAGYIKDLASIVANSVSLTPQVPWQAMVKMMAGPELLEGVLGYSYVTPKIPYMPGKGFGKALYWMERSLRHECKEPACHLVSFMWGWGFPAAFNHRNIHPITHRRLMDLFGGTSFNYYRHIRKMLMAKASVSYSADPQINYLEQLGLRQLPPTLLISGSENRIFPQSNKKTYELLKATANGSQVRYKEFAGYGHQDVFIGQYCDQEVFPKLTEFLKEHSLQTEQSVQKPAARRLRVAS